MQAELPPTLISPGKLTPDDHKVDRVVDSCFQLLSLFFMTIGRNNEAPAAYALTSTIKRLLDHLTEANLFSEKDLTSISHSLERLSAIIGRTPTTDVTASLLETLLFNRIERCRQSLDNLKKTLEDYAEPIRATHEKLVSILRQMAVVTTKSRVTHPAPAPTAVHFGLLTRRHPVPARRHSQGSGAAQGDRRQTSGRPLRWYRWQGSCRK